MEEITASLSNTMAVSENNVHDQHPRFSEYKNEGKISESQRARRTAQFERQSKARDACLNRIRALYDKDYNDVDDMDHIDEPSHSVYNEFGDSSTKEADKINQEVKAKPKRKNLFADYLMFSEWLVDIPDIGTLSTDWLMLPCPIGKRTLIVARNGSTIAYSKSGYQVGSYQTDLPGGNSLDAQGFTMLDCISVKDGSHCTFYVLDILCWGNTPFTDTEFECRRYFLQSKLDEMPQLEEGKRCSFRSLPSCRCTVEAMTELMKEDFQFKLDGLLFYHAKVFYTPGQTPLVGWLKPWMLPEILNVEVNDSLISGQGYYANAKQYIDKFNEKHHFKSSIKPQVSGGDNIPSS